MPESTRNSWIDEDSQTPLIDEYAQQLDSYVETFADGRVDATELESQEARVRSLMQTIEPQLDDVLHEQVTRLLCELTAYDIMRCLFELENATAQTKFQG